MILGASVRSAGFSSLRLGVRPTCADLFADLDLALACPTTRIAPGTYPEGLADLAETLPSRPWLYTGALENRPDLVDRISLRHPLLGNPGSTLLAVRDPEALARAVRNAGMVAPAVQLDDRGVPTDGSWLVKPLASAAGRGIRPWFGRRTLETSKRVYYQERVDGLSMAAQFVGDGLTARSLGLARQFVGRPGNPFAYRGSLGPWPVSSEVRRRVEILGQAVASRFGLVGLFGIDLVLREGQPLPVEVNPRYTASVEVLEWAAGSSLMLEHLQAFGHDPPKRPEIDSQGFVGKAILYADRACRWPSTNPGSIAQPGEFPEVADLPEPGTAFSRGDPVLTVLARGDSPEECRRALGLRLRVWRSRLRPEC